ncbi:MAG: SemiSWEET transporter [Flavobacteriaceae bacterium]|nr:SemiSWEET transporter [Flavobacteriaceae bacterium]
MDRSLIIELIGFTAAILTTAAFLPQVYKIWKTKDVKALSLPMYLMFFLGVGLWLTYGIMIESPSLIVANGITVVSALFILIYILRYRNS